MEFVLSYGARFYSGCSALGIMVKQTGKCVTDAVRYLCDVCEKEFHLIEGLDSMNCVNMIEPLIHSTAAHPYPRYDFDLRFPNFPSYLRRSAIASAAGKVRSYRSLVRNWEEGGRRGRCPAFPALEEEPVTLYYGNMFVFTDKYGSRLGKGELSVYGKVKVFCSQRQLTQDRPLTKEERRKFSSGQEDINAFVWDWVPVRIKPSDIHYLQRMQEQGRKVLAPVLLTRGKRHFLQFATKIKQPLGEKEIFGQTILAADLGINNPATCCVMRPDGTVLARRFYHPAADKGLLEHRLNMVSRAQSHGSRKTPVLWRMADNANRKLSDGAADFIMSVAEEFSVDVIVFEHLELSGKKRGSKKKRLHHWRANYVQELVSNRAHARGMRIARICAWGTSRLAFDGSGRVERGINNNYSTCRFQNGKVYNCDLSASYNIGARYFIREIMKTMPARVWSELTAKVPELAKRTTCTLSSLIRLNAVLPPSGGGKPDGSFIKLPEGI